MHARATAAEFQTCRDGTRDRVCPGCGAEIDLAAYGCLGARATVVCPACSRGTPERRLRRH